MSALQGIRVIDFSAVMSGPYTAMLLGLLGAEVIRVESRARPDSLRARVPGWFISVNLNKLGLSLNLRHPEAVAIAKRLVSISDVVIENYRPGVMQRLGLGYNMLSGVNPALVMLSCSAYGQKGPDAQLGGYAAIFAAMSGLSHITGYPDGPSTAFRNSADLRAGQFGALSILVALLHAKRTGKGQHIDLSASEALTAEIGDVLMDYTMNRNIESRRGNRDDIAAPHNCYRCLGEDNWISIVIWTEREWEILCRVMGEPQWTKEERFSDCSGRWSNQEELDRLLETWTINYDSYALKEMLQNAGIAAVPSFKARQLLDDPHLRSHGFVQRVPDPKLGQRRILALPWRFSKTTTRPCFVSHEIGENNSYVLCDLLGMTSNEVKKLASEGVI